MKIRVIHTNGGMTTLDNVEKLYLLEGEATVGVIHDEEPKEEKCEKCGHC